jgi:hypothetical protein
LQLKKKQEELHREIKVLKERLREKDEQSRLALEQELKGLAAGKKSEWDRKHPKAARGASSGKNLQSNKV